MSDSILSLVWDPRDDNGVSTLRFGELRARVRKSALRHEGFLWVIDKSRRGHGLLQVASGIRPTRAEAKRIAEGVLNLLRERAS
jgi:hypothetical protein